MFETLFFLALSPAVVFADYLVYVSGSDPYKPQTNPSNLSVFNLDTTGQLQLEFKTGSGVKSNWHSMSEDGMLLVGANSLTVGVNATVRTYSVETTDSKVDVTFLSTGDCFSKGASAAMFHHTKRWVVTANYKGGSVSLLPVDENGFVSDAVQVIKHQGVSTIPPYTPRAHDVAFVGDFVFIPDLGLDKVFQYKLNTVTGQLSENLPHVVFPSSSGPRHINFHPTLSIAYVITERSHQLMTLEYDTITGKLTIIQTLSTLPLNTTLDPSWRAAEVVVHPSGAFVYGTNRGDNSIVEYSVNAKDGMLTLLGHISTGNWPRGMEVSPDGLWIVCANERAHQLQVLSVDLFSGLLTTVSIYNISDIYTPPNNVLIRARETGTIGSPTKEPKPEQSAAKELDLSSAVCSFLLVFLCMMMV